MFDIFSPLQLYTRYSLDATEFVKGFNNLDSDLTNIRENKTPNQLLGFINTSIKQRTERKLIQSDRRWIEVMVKSWQIGNT